MNITYNHNPLLLDTKPKASANMTDQPVDGTIPAAKQKYVPASGTYPKGFLASATYVGVKASNKSRPDLAFLASETPCTAAAVFTKNLFQAAPVTVSRKILERGKNSGIRSIIVNSGCANAVTGAGGLADAERMVEHADNCFEAPEDGKGSSSIVMSTGVIGQRFAYDLSVQRNLADLQVDYPLRRFYKRSHWRMKDWETHMSIGWLRRKLYAPPTLFQNSSPEPSPFHHLRALSTEWQE